MKHPGNIESIINIVDGYGNRKLANELREYMAPLIQPPRICVDIASINPEDLKPGAITFVPAESEVDTRRLDLLQSFVKPSGKKNRLQIFFNGTLREYLDDVSRAAGTEP